MGLGWEELTCTLLQYPFLLLCKLQWCRSVLFVVAFVCLFWWIWEFKMPFPPLTGWRNFAPNFLFLEFTIPAKTSSDFKSQHSWAPFPHPQHTTLRQSRTAQFLPFLKTLADISTLTLPHLAPAGWAESPQGRNKILPPFSSPPNEHRAGPQ